MTERSTILPGTRYGRLVVIAEAKQEPGWNRMFQCKCDCGTERAFRLKNLRSGTSKSCGCLRKEGAHDRMIRHGMANKTPEYRAWSAIKSRCRSDLDCHKWWAKRGIKVCDRWIDSFENFLADMGPRPSAKHSIDRINVDGGYAPENCRWATRREQSLNTTRSTFLNFEGKPTPLMEVAEKLGIDYDTLYRRIHVSGWSEERAMTSKILSASEAGKIGGAARVAKAKAMAKGHKP